MLVDGQGNFGSLDGDPPAAMRYTEARLAAPAMDILADIGKNTVDFVDNFDGTLTEPKVLPSAIPNLLVNGATGIAVGMATSIPPHNLGEIVDASQYMLKHWEKLDDLSIEDLMRFVQGPDFPTGGIILHDATGDGMNSAYSTGRGQVTVQARAHLEEMERGRNRIIVSELPYMTNKSSLIERIADLAREGRLEGIVDLRDESDRHGMRIVIELNKTADPEVVLRDLYKQTPMQSTFSIIMLALVDGEPRHLSLKQALKVYIEHRLEIVRRRSEYDLEKAKQRAHILEGLRVALKNLDEVIALIRKAPDADAARDRLMKRFKLSEVQAQAILDMPLRRLAALERKKIELEYQELMVLIKEIEALLASPIKMRGVISSELQRVKEAYGDRRRTHIAWLKEGQHKTSLLTTSALMPEKSIWVAITAEGLVSRTLEEKLPRVSGKEAPAWLVRANTREILYLVDEKGEAAAIPVHAVPETDSPAAGVPLTKISPLQQDSVLAAAFTLPARAGREDESGGGKEAFVCTATRGGIVKKTLTSDLPGASANTFTLVKVNEEDRLGWVQISDGHNEILLATRKGMAIRFSEEEVRPMGLVAGGVMGIKLQKGDEVIGMEILPKAGEVFLITANGKAKRVAADQFPKQGRYGQGVQAWPLVEKETLAGMAVGQGKAQATLFMEKLLPRTITLDEAPVQGRSSRGKAIEEIKPGNEIKRLSIPWGSQPVERAAEEPKPVKRQKVEKVKTAAPKTKPTAKSGGKEAQAKSPPQATPKTKLSVKPPSKPAQAKPKAKPATKSANKPAQAKSPPQAKPKAKPAIKPPSKPAQAKSPPQAKPKAKPATKSANKPAQAKSPAGKKTPQSASKEKAKPSAAKPVPPKSAAKKPAEK